MKILKQEKKGNQVSLEVEEDFSKLEPHVEKAYAEASREINLPGFRPGKIPADLLKKYIHEDAVIDRALQFLLYDIYPDIIKDSNIKPVDHPEVEVKKLAKGFPIVISMKIDVYPEIKLGSYKGLALKKQDVVVTDEEIIHTLEHVKKDYAKNMKLKNEDVKLDDEFAKTVSKLNTMDDLKALLRVNIESEKKKEADMALRDEATVKLSEVTEVDIPKGMIEHEIEDMIADLETSLKRNRMSLSSYLAATKKDMDKLKGEMRHGAEVRLKAKMALEAIAEKEKLNVDQADVDREIAALAMYNGQTAEEYKAGLSEGVLDSISDFLKKEKAIDFVISKAKVE